MGSAASEGMCRSGEKKINFANTCSLPWSLNDLYYPLAAPWALGVTTGERAVKEPSSDMVFVSAVTNALIISVTPGFDANCHAVPCGLRT